MRPLALRLVALLIATAPAARAADDTRPDLPIARFEGDHYDSGWLNTGTAFGRGPASGALPGQMPVEGFAGHGLANSYHGGDDAEGSLLSPEFRIERPCINLLVGGGKYPGETCADLVVGGQVVRTATGPNDRPGGSERLDWISWDVTDLAGRTATLRINDRRRGGWGHITVDQVGQSDIERQARPISRTITANRRYLHLPVDPEAIMRRVRIVAADGRVVRDFDIRLGTRSAEFIAVAAPPAPPAPPILRGDTRSLLKFYRPTFRLLASVRPSLPTDQFVQTQLDHLLDGWERSLGLPPEPRDPPPPPEPSREFLAFLDLTSFQGQALRVSTDAPPDDVRLNAISLSDELPSQRQMYAERDRPLVHFTSRRGWLNDPNGLVWFAGKYHLFYQHNPFGWDWGNMHWGHATSPDLVHWTEQPIALAPRKYGDWAFSGSAVVDRDNTSGFGVDGKAPLVAAFTSTGRGECIVFSRDEGQTWTEFAGNPVVRHHGRDPRLFWHEPTKRWIMAVYDEGADGRDRAIAFHSSPDLRTWTAEGRIDGFYECPDLFELPFAGGCCSGPPRTYWVLSAADGRYRLGQFDGHDFTPETPMLTLWNGDFYAAQTFSNAPDGRRIQIGWARGIDFPRMPFNQQMTVPCQLTLRETDDGPRLCAEPVAEVRSLRPAQSRGWCSLNLPPGPPNPELDPITNVAPGTGGPAGAIDMEVTLSGDAPGGWSATILGARVAYDGVTQMLDVAGLAVPVPLVDGKIKLRILADRRSLEVFAADGRVAISRRIAPGPADRSVEYHFERHPHLSRQFDCGDYPLKSSW